jgi:sugar phosphate isomerase/epimerase
VVLHLGLKDDSWDDSAIEHSLTAIEHLKAFAAPLGVRLLLENVQNEVTTPEHLLYILKTGHFDSVGVCLDIGHLHLATPANDAPVDSGVGAAVDLLGSRIAQVHIHDNHGPFPAQRPFSDSTDMKDEHLWPGDGTVNWHSVTSALVALSAKTPGILEIVSDRDEPPDSVTNKAVNTFRTLEEHASVQDL